MNFSAQSIVSTTTVLKSCGKVMSLSTARVSPDQMFASALGVEKDRAGKLGGECGFAKPLDSVEAKALSLGYSASANG